MTKNKISKSEAAETKALKKALENAKMQERALNTLIDIAEEKLTLKSELLIQDTLQNKEINRSYLKRW